MKLVYFSPVPWESFAQRPHKFVDWFQKKFDATVLWVDPYPTRLPILSDYRRLRLSKPAYSKQEGRSWLTVLRPRALPIEPLPYSAAINRLFWRRALGEICAFSDDATYLAVGKPSKMAIMTTKMLPGKLSLYDGMDDFPAFYSGWSRRAMLKRETWLIKEAKHVITSSTLLQQRWSQIRPDVQLIANGLDFGAMPNHSLTRRRDGEKVFGYIGTISTWFDWEWVIHLCNVRTSDVIRIIGPRLQPPPANLPKNLELLPACSHQDAMKAIHNFDVGLIPFKRNDLTAAVDPIKYYEYRALGLPILSTAFGEMVYRQNEEGTYISQGLHDIATLLDRALSFQFDYEKIKAFKHYASWEVRFENAVLF